MALVFVHGVATRPSPEYLAEVAQRDALFQRLVPKAGSTVLNPDWGSHAAQFSADLPWLPTPIGNEAFGAPGDTPAPLTLSLGGLAQRDVATAVDLTIAAMLEARLQDAVRRREPKEAADSKSIDLARAAAAYLDQKAPDETPLGISALQTSDNTVFAAALESQLRQTGTLEAYGGIGDAIKSGFQTLGGWIGAGLSDAALRFKRAQLSRLVAFFLGDIFVYLRERETAGEEGVQERLFRPIIDDLVKGWLARRDDKEPLVVVGHSLGGVLLIDLLTDPSCIARLAAEAPGFRIDLLTTVGSQPGFFADLQLYKGKPQAGGRLEKPPSVSAWRNVFDYTDIFSFLTKPAFNDVADLSYDTAVDLFAAHTSYFKRPSFYQRLGRRLGELAPP